MPTDSAEKGEEETEEGDEEGERYLFRTPVSAASCGRISLPEENPTRGDNVICVGAILFIA